MTWPPLQSQSARSCLYTHVFFIVNLGCYLLSSEAPTSRESRARQRVRGLSQQFEITLGARKSDSSAADRSRYWRLLLVSPIVPHLCARFRLFQMRLANTVENEHVAELVLLTSESTNGPRDRNPVSEHCVHAPKRIFR